MKVPVVDNPSSSNLRKFISSQGASVSLYTFVKAYKQHLQTLSISSQSLLNMFPSMQLNDSLRFLFTSWFSSYPLE